MAIWRCWSAGRFLRVRAALAERDIWLRIAPHLVRPMRFAIPAHSEERPPWLLRSGLLLYDRLASRSGLPASATVDVTHHPVGNALKRPFGTAFEYSDCVVDDFAAGDRRTRSMRRSAAPMIRTGARCVRADRLDTWRLAVIDRGHRQVMTARALANASGRLDRVGRRDRVAPCRRRTLAVDQMSQIVVRRLFDSDNVYVFQNGDGRLIFASPYERDFTLIGAVGHAFKGDPAIVATVGRRCRLSLRCRQPLFSRADRGGRRGANGFGRQHGDEPPQVRDRHGMAR